MNIETQIFVAGRMPALKHSQSDPERILDGESEAAEWLCRQPEIRAMVFADAKWRALIACDPVTGLWRGSPELYQFIPFTEAEVLEILDKPLKQMQMFEILQLKHRRPMDKTRWGMALALLMKSGKLVTHVTGIGRRKSRWFGRPGETFETCKIVERPRTGAGISLDEMLVAIGRYPGGVMAGEIVKVFSNAGAARSTIYMRLKDVVLGKFADKTKGRYVLTPEGVAKIGGLEKEEDKKTAGLNGAGEAEALATPSDEGDIAE